MNGLQDSSCMVPEKPVYVLDACQISATAPHLQEDGTSSPQTCMMAEEPDYKSVITDANLRRRMGRLLKMAVYCGLKTLENVSPEDVCGIITATGMGFMKDTITMADNMIDRKEEMLNPMPFMQSTFNTASGYIALMRGIRSYNTTYVHRETGMLAALTDAIMLAGDNPGKGVLVGGFDEVTPQTDRLRRRLGEYEVFDGQYLPLGEGAGFMYLACNGVAEVRKPLARLLAISSSNAGCQDFMETCVAKGVIRDCSPAILRCSDFVPETGAFMTMLPVVLCKILSSYKDTMPALIIDDVNRHGGMILFETGPMDLPGSEVL